MNITEIQRLLHHRSPYLMIDKVLDISSHLIVTEKNLTEDEFFFKGHFPGAPVLPGAMMQEITTQSAGILISKLYAPVENYDSESTKGLALGVLKKVNYAKYKSFARPGDTLCVKVSLEDLLDNLFNFKAEITTNNKLVMKNSFQLMNISDKHLY